MCSTNRALVESMECYMDNLIDSFQDFVNRSLVMLSVGACTVVAMFIYVVKLITESRVPVVNCSTSNEPCINIPTVACDIPKVNCDIPKADCEIPKVCPTVPKECSSNIVNVCSSIPKVCSSIPKVCSSIPKVCSSFPKICSRQRSDFLIKCNDDVACASVTCDLPMTVSQDERVLREFRFNNARDNDIKQKACAGTSARISIPSLPTFLPGCIAKRICASAPPKHCPRNLVRASCCSLCCDEDKKHC